MSTLAAENPPCEQFESLAAAGVVHGFVGRVSGVEVDTGRAEVLARLDDYHRTVRRRLNLADRQFTTAEQVHGSKIAVLRQTIEAPHACSLGSDGLITNRTDVCLGIYVADCCAVYLVDSAHRAIGLVHSGKKGTQLNIVADAIRAMGDHFGTLPGDLIVQLSPCIRPPWYEVDFAAEIAAQCQAAGVVRVSDEGTCTAANPDRYYSYRRAKGRTGRMLALLALR